MKVYTRNGDGGQTSLMGEKNVVKDDVRIEANGMLDELNAVLGVVKAAMPESPRKGQIDAIQNQVMRIMGVVAGARMNDMTALTGLTTQLEQDIDAMAVDGKFCFSVPGETLLNAWLHVPVPDVARPSVGCGPCTHVIPWTPPSCNSSTA